MGCAMERAMELLQARIDRLELLDEIRQFVGS
jgi:hypothetical protein